MWDRASSYQGVPWETEPPMFWHLRADGGRDTRPELAPMNDSPFLKKEAHPLTCGDAFCNVWFSSRYGQKTRR